IHHFPSPPFPPPVCLSSLLACYQAKYSADGVPLFDWLPRGAEAWLPWGLYKHCCETNRRAVQLLTRGGSKGGNFWKHIGQESFILAASAPCGLRGLMIDLCVEQGDVCENMAELSVDPYLVPTFQLTLVLRLESSGQAIKLSTGFPCYKKKLYCSEDLLIEEC
uniref:DNA damage-inducible transcript 4 protein n=1 Tax=Sphaeramia orbicularis TaxID=375764 RepID=A0A672YM03_9TELE